MTLTRRPHNLSIDELMERASAALNARDYFGCEELCLDALERAHAEHNYERMARIVMPLQEARRNLRLEAIDASQDRVSVIEKLPEESASIEPGCYLARPPLVGADGRMLRERADAARVPVFVLVREPTTRSGQVPIVMIGPITVRAYVQPPEDEDAPGMPWFVAAAEAMGDAAITSVPESASLEQRVNHLYARLGTVPEHEKLHQALAAACEEAASQSQDAE